MARPHKDNAEYHSHDKDMRNDPKIRALRKKYGHEGYSIFNMLLEVLTGSRNFEIDWNPTAITLLEGDFDTENLEDIVNYCISHLSLFVIENGKLYSNRHRERFYGLLLKRERQRNAVIVSDNTQSKVNKSKVKEIKEENKDSNTLNDLIVRLNSEKKIEKNESEKSGDSGYSWEREYLKRHGGV